MNPLKPSIGRSLAEAADKADELTRFRDQFVFGEEGVIYLDGNSLGRLPKKSETALHRTVHDEWGRELIRGWGNEWLSMPRRTAAKISTLIGASENEVVVCDSTSINLFKLATAAVGLRKGSVILGLESDFPSNLYVLGGIGELRTFASIEQLLQNLDDAALVSLSHTCYRTGEVLDMRSITETARKAGVMVLWDLSHSVGAMPLYLNKYHVDLAVGCTYKYLNGGPGAPAFLYVREALLPQLSNPIQGWFGHADQFKFSPEFQPAESIEKFMTGTPPVLSLSALEPALDIILEAGIERIRKKSFLMTEYLIALCQERLEKFGVKVVSPLESGKRGSHVALSHPEAWQLSQALIAHGVIPDFREPDILRIGLAPVYTSFVDIYDGVTVLETILTGNLHLKYAPGRVGIS